MTGNQIGIIWKLANEIRAANGQKELLWGDIKYLIAAIENAAIKVAK